LKHFANNASLDALPCHTHCCVSNSTSNGKGNSNGNCCFTYSEASHPLLQAEQLARDLQALQQEHHSLGVTYEGEQQHSRLLQDNVTQLQVSISIAGEQLNCR